MKKAIEYFTVIIITVVIMQCSNPIEPPKQKVIKDPKDYTWTIDTLRATPQDQIVMISIWGDSPDNLYVVGHSSSSAQQMWHYDGKVWSPVVTLPFARRVLIDIYGFSSEDIWAVGIEEKSPTNGSYILHFDGSSWKKVNINGELSLETIWGNSPTDIWTAGINLFHYNGVSWDKVDYYNPKPQRFPEIFTGFVSIAGFSSNNVYFAGDALDNTKSPFTEYYLLYHYNGKTIEVIDSTDYLSNRFPPKFGLYLRAIEGTLYSAGYGLFKRTANGWDVILTNTEIGRVDGTNSNHIFAAGDGETIYFYDGNVWKSLIPVPGFNLPVYDIIVFDNEVFIVTHDGWTTYILHGK